MQLVGRLYSLFYATPPLVFDHSIYIESTILYMKFAVRCHIVQKTTLYVYCMYVYSILCVSFCIRKLHAGALTATFSFWFPSWTTGL